MKDFFSKYWIWLLLLGLSIFGAARLSNYEYSGSSVGALFGILEVFRVFHVPDGLGLWAFTVCLGGYLIWRVFQSEGKQSKIVWIVFSITAVVLLVILLID